MKQIFFIIIMLCIGKISIANESNPNEGSIVIYLTDDEREHVNDPTTQKPDRSLSIPSASAYIYNNIVSIDFNKSSSAVIVSIIRVSTGESIYTNRYSYPTNINIDLSNTVSGEYQLQIETNNESLSGYFTR